MMKRKEVRLCGLAIAWAALTCVSRGAAQTSQTASQAGANAQSKSAPRNNTGADAAAYAKLNSGQVDEAAAAFQAVLAVQPNDAGALAGMGQVRMLQGNYLGAVSFLEQAKQASPDDSAIAAALDGARFRFLMGEGKDALTANDKEDAEKRYREALELRPDETDVVTALANVLVQENRLGDAQQVLLAAVAHDAAAHGEPPADLAMQLAQLDIANSQPELAYPIFLQVVQQSSERVDVWSGLISALHLMGHDADAVAQEKVIPAEIRAQLEATPGFGQMMVAMANAPAKPVAAGEPSYTPFVPSAAPVVASPALVAAPAASAAVPVPEIQRPLASAPRSQAGASSAVVKPSVAKAASTPKPVAMAPSQPVRVPAATMQAATPSRSSGVTGSDAPLVTQPAAKPAVRGEEIPDTGDQQYPQPKARPRVSNAN